MSCLHVPSSNLHSLSLVPYLQVRKGQTETEQNPTTRQLLSAVRWVTRVGCWTFGHLSNPRKIRRETGRLAGSVGREPKVQVVGDRDRWALEYLDLDLWQEC